MTADSPRVPEAAQPERVLVGAPDKERPDAREGHASLFAVIAALEYYANPETYWGIAMFGDAPHGDFFDDFEKYPWPGDYSIQDKPGRRAREALRELAGDAEGLKLLEAYLAAGGTT